ncbi:TetR family transcriptional regulator [Microbacterium sp. H1-D42]|uniref:TetR/AcrR family transcriptional regulator n=1 Tax=Microbacterium sp. H1-D42 TaxID=2925844 RepID=UPI001F5394E7|nr:TetR family transcriptional regulator [Microbacterium sp. H1-D42]UNK70535.1 TetR family transcriptional regulator [Microbacterium sp. H1-D42]
MTDAVPRRKRDPESRRRAIVEAAAELIVEIGVGALTHRLIAARAGVPLGATTQYFATLDDLRAEALHFLVAEVDLRVDSIRAALDERGATPAVLAELLAQGLADAHAIEADRAVVTAAVNDPQLRELARRWSQQMAGFLVADYGQQRAAAAAIFIDGVLWHSRINDEPLSESFLETALAALLGAPTP